ncbi:retrovirus-related pol polyprotein from transposon TNT 1-94 [Tanacetum coccineum]
MGLNNVRFVELCIIENIVVQMGRQLNAAPMLEVENFTNWKNRFMRYIIGIEPQFKNILLNGPYVLMTAGQRKPKGQWTGLLNSPDDEEDTRTSQEYMNDLEEEYQERALLAKSKRFFKKGSQRFNSAKATDDTIYFEAKYNKVKAKLALLSFGASSSTTSMVKNKVLIAETYEWDEEDVSFDDNEMTEVKVLMALASEENIVVSKESARNGEWVKITIKSWRFHFANHDTGRILPVESQVKLTNSLVAIIDPSATDQSTFKSETLKGKLKNASASKFNSAPTSKLKNVKTKDDLPLSISDIKKPIWYLDNGCSRHMTGVKSYLHNYVEQPDPKVVFEDDATCVTKGYGSIKCNGIVLTKVAFVNGLKYNLVSISQLCDAKYTIQFDEKRGTTFKSNKEIVMIAPRTCSSKLQNNQLAKQNLVIGLPLLVYSKDKPCSSCEKGKHYRASFKTKQTSSIKKCLHLLHMDLFGPVTPRSINHDKYTLVIVEEYSSVDERKNRTLIEAARTMLLGSGFSKQYWIEAVATACYTQNRSTIVKRYLKTPYEIFHGRIPNVDFLHVFGCPVYIHKHKDYLGKFDEKAYDGYFLGYSLISKAFRVFNTRRQQTKETYHITFDESTYVIKFTKTLVINITIAESKRYPPDVYLHPYEPSQRYQVNSNDVSFIEPYEIPELVVLETDVSLDQNDQIDLNDQNDHPAQIDEI